MIKRTYRLKKRKEDPIMVYNENDASAQSENAEDFLQQQRLRAFAYAEAAQEVDEGDGEGGWDAGSTGTGEIKPEGFYQVLPEETFEMEVERRKLEQAGHRHYANVNARDKRPPGQDNGPGESLKQHPNPIFQSQLFAGDFSPTDYSPSDLWRYEQDRQEQEKQKELRMANTLKQQNNYRNTYIPTLKN